MVVEQVFHEGIQPAQFRERLFLRGGYRGGRGLPAALRPRKSVAMDARPRAL